jgi:hypothetical protein
MEKRKVEDKNLNYTKTPWQWQKQVTEALLASLTFETTKNLELIDTNKIYKALHDLQDRYPSWLASIFFEGSKESYYSKQLEDAMFSLGTMGLITLENHDYRCVRIEKGTKDVIKASLETKFEKGELEELTRLSNDFTQLVSNPK